MKELARNRQRSLKPFLFGYLVVTIIAVVVVGVYSLHRVQDLYVNQTAEDLEARARLSANPIAERLLQGDTDTVDALCKKLGSEVNTRITVIRPDGQVVGDTEESPQAMENHADRPEIAQVLADPAVVGESTRYSTTLEETLMYRAVAVLKDEAPIAVVRTSIPITTLDARLDAAYRGVATAGLVGMLVIIGAMPWFSIRLTRLTTQTKQRSAGEHPRSDAQEPDESTAFQEG